MAQTDREALVAFYNATDGPNWQNKTNWGSGAPLSDWYGVTANDQGSVVELSLSGNSLRGIFKPTLRMSLTFLKNILTESDPFMKFTGNIFFVVRPRVLHAVYA